MYKYVQACTINERFKTKKMSENPQKREIVAINGEYVDITGKKVFHYRSPVKLWVRFNRENYEPTSPTDTDRTRKWDMRELIPTVKQVMYQNFYPHINLESAVNRAIHLLNDNLHGRYEEARIYLEMFAIDQETGRNVQRGRVIHTFINGKQIHELDKPIDYASAGYLDWIKQREIELSKSFDEAQFVIDYPFKRQVYQRNQFQIF